MDYLTRMFSQAARDPRFRFHPLCQQLRLTNLAFADDLLVFCKGDTTSVSIVKDVMDQFAALSGLQANLNKSSIYMAGMRDSKQHQLLQLTGFEKGIFPMKYLGFPISGRSWSKTDCQSLVSKVVTRLNCWATRHLSFAGRTQLINSVLHSFHLYWATTFLIPKGTLEEIDKHCRKFLWSGNQ